MRRKLISRFVLLFLLTATAVRADSVDDYIKAQMQEQHIPGVSVAVVQQGNLIKAEGYGFANLELNVPAKADTVYKIASISKQFIATGILLLSDEGVISLDDKASKYLEGTPNSWSKITIRHLLTHTSGLVSEAPGFDPLKTQSDADLIRSAYGKPFKAQPGVKWEYCNLGYFILAEIIRKVTNKPWPDYITARVFRPLEMNSTRTTTLSDLVLNRANGYVWKDGGFQNADVLIALRPSGAFLSTALDLAKWDAALYTDKILKQSLRDQMWTPVTLNDGSSYDYGFGWRLDLKGPHKRIHHDGVLPGFRAEIARFIDDKLTIIVLTNGNEAKATAISLGVARFYIQ